MSQKLENNKTVWDHKPVLREIYHDFYRRIHRHLTEGKTLEIGSGTGNMKEYSSNVVATDISFSPWLDCAMDAQRMPFADNSFNNIVAVDVLHHIERPLFFFQEASRILNKGGRIVLLDPAITLFSYVFYKFIHEEPVDMGANPLEDLPFTKNRDPFDANQGFPTLLFERYRKMFTQTFPALHLKEKQYMSLWVYPLSGGFQKWCLVPKFLTKPLLKLEHKLEPFLGQFLSFRLLIVLEKAT